MTQSLKADLAELKNRLLEIHDLHAAASVLGWDQATYMPSGGAAARGRQGATLSRLAHEKSVDPALGKIIDRLESESAASPADSDDASLVRVARRDFEKAIKVPPDHVARASALAAASYDAWTRARPANDFAAMIPYLEQAIELSREYGSFFAPYDHIADPLIDSADEGMTTALIKWLFADLERELVPMAKAIADQPVADDQCLRGLFGESEQMKFGLSVIKQMGYDFERGRIDKTHHPFCTKFSVGDVRITTRVDETHLGEALFSTIHETGHALYEQGVSSSFEGMPLASGVSAGVHESQSRLWENVVSRSRGFWEYFYPVLQQAFPNQLRGVALETFYRAINKVEPSLIRTDADEVTYNLHVMMRFDLELAMLEGHLKVKDLPEAWRAGMQARLGVVPPDDSNGCLQDVHWYGGGFGGGFQGYTIGNILSAQFYEAAVSARPEIPGDMKAGQFATLHKWLRENLYRHGRKFTPNEIIERATGKPMSTGPYLTYLRKKYGELYKLSGPSS
ncbi:MAG TPA: carboxypeptidase M32 [Xanthobacteraceae bacterium]|jgi:carboxypeptidase Taq|nr:carboxypeptidase M32 [Xanthobacteraceae bacterium]